MAAPTLITSYLVDSLTNTGTSLVSPSFTPGNGEVLVIKTVTESTGQPSIGTVSGGGQAYTVQQVDNGTSNECGIQIATAVVSGSPGAMTVTQAFSGGTGLRAMVVERWSDAQLAVTPASTKAHGTGAPSVNLATAQNNSVISWVSGDWDGNGPGSAAYRSGATQDGLEDQSGSGNYVGYFAYQAAAAAGSQTMGLTAPTGQAYNLAGIEIQYLDLAPPPADPWVTRTVLSGSSTARNGTTSHTCTFTPAAAGNFLVAVMSGAVAFSTPTGWTLVNHAAVSSGLYVFSKTAASGESSFTTSHGTDSNYAILGVVYEFPAGTTVLGSSASGALSTAATTPALSGLSGTYAVFAARSWTMGNGTVTTASVNWTAPVSKDYDAFVLYGGSPAEDGTTLSVAYGANQTAASFTPSSVYSFNGTGAGTGANGAGVSWALQLGVASTNNGAGMLALIDT